MRSEFSLKNEHSLFSTNLFLTLRRKKFTVQLKHKLPQHAVKNICLAKIKYVPKSSVLMTINLRWIRKKVIEKLLFLITSLLTLFENDIRKRLF